jgi:hypothetical protein
MHTTFYIWIAVPEANLIAGNVRRELTHMFWIENPPISSALTFEHGGLEPGDVGTLSVDIHWHCMG